MGLPDMTPGMNTAIDTPPDLFSFFAPPLNGRTIQKMEITKNKRLFINASSVARKSGNPPELPAVNLPGQKKAPENPGLFSETSVRPKRSQTQFSSIRTIPSAPEFHRFSLRHKRKVAGYTAGWELESRLPLLPAPDPENRNTSNISLIILQINRPQ
jgi:hypothetical protein